MVDATEIYHIDKITNEVFNTEQRYHLYLATNTWYILD